MLPLSQLPTKAPINSSSSPLQEKHATILNLVEANRPEYNQIKLAIQQEWTKVNNDHRSSKGDLVFNFDTFQEFVAKQSETGSELYKKFKEEGKTFPDLEAELHLLKNFDDTYRAFSRDPSSRARISSRTLAQVYSNEERLPGPHITPFASGGKHRRASTTSKRFTY